MRTISVINIDFLKLLNQRETKVGCNTIVLITDDSNTSIQLKARIYNYININCLDEYYKVITLTRADLQELFDSKDKVLWFDKHIQSQTELPV